MGHGWTGRVTATVELDGGETGLGVPALLLGDVAEVHGNRTVSIRQGGPGGADLVEFTVCG